MTNETILEAVHSFAKEKGLNYEALILSSPPALLDLLPTMQHAELPSDFSGVCLTINEPEPTDEAAASLGIWIPVSGKGGSYIKCREGDGEIGTHAKDWFNSNVMNGTGAEEPTALEALKATLTGRLSEFLQEYVFGPALDEWLSIKGLSATPQKPDIVGGTAVEYDIHDWYILEFSEPWPEYPFSQIIGVSGDGFVSLFNLNHIDDLEYYWNFLDLEPHRISKPSELITWLEKHIILKKDIPN